MPIRSNRPVAITASTAVNRHVQDNKPIVVNAAAGATVTLPLATGTGAKFKVVVGTLLTSNTVVVKASGSGLFFGGALTNDIGDSSAATADFYPTASDSNTFTMTASIGGGKVGDWFEAIDIATNKWAVFGVQAGLTDPTSPFSAT
jgi:hypothetical protein